MPSSRGSGRPRGRGWLLGRVAGVPVVLGPGWAFASLLLVAVFGPAATAAIPGVSRAGGFLVAAGWALLLYGSILLHELAHALAARSRGVAVGEIHLTLVGGHTEMGQAPTPATSAAVAAAGPAANLVVAAVTAGLAQVVPERGALAWLLLSLAGTNVLVTVFNLLPGLPMDGGWILEALVWRVAGRREAGTVAAAWIGRVVGVGLVVAVVAVPLVRGERPGLFQVAWAALIGAMLWSSAGAFLRRTAALRAVGTLDLGRLVRPVVVVPVHASLAQADAAADAAGQGTEVLVAEAGDALVGWVDPGAAAAVPDAARASTPVTAVLVPLPAGAAVAAHLTGQAAVEAVARASRVSPVLVAHDDAGRLVGLLRHADVVGALRRAT